MAPSIFQPSDSHPCPCQWFHCRVGGLGGGGLRYHQVAPLLNGHRSLNVSIRVSGVAVVGQPLLVCALPEPWCVVYISSLSL